MGFFVFAPVTRLPSPCIDIAAPIGVFDSGVGGLSVLRALHAQLPGERFVYLADSAHAPYGEKGDALVRARSLAIAEHLVQQQRIKALVVACNTATAAAIDALRTALPQLPIVGVEPALKPAAQESRTHHVGVLATRGTLESARFARLQQAQGQGTRFHVQPCDGLAWAIEQSTSCPANDTQAAARIRALCARYTTALGRFGQGRNEIDTLVLGCTHYVFARQELQALVGPRVRLIDTGAAVARHTAQLLRTHGALHMPAPHAGSEDALTLLATDALAALQAAAARWLNLPASRCHAVTVL